MEIQTFYIREGILQVDTLAPLLFIICLYYVLRTSIDLHFEKGFTLHNSRSRRYPAVTITDAEYADDLALYTDTCAYAELPIQVGIAAIELNSY